MIVHNDYSELSHKFRLILTVCNKCVMVQVQRVVVALR